MTRLPTLVLEVVCLALSELQSHLVVALLVISFLAVTSATSFCGTDESLIDAIDAMKHSIVPIVYVTVYQDGSHDYDGIEGTGFFIGKGGFFVTAAHVARTIQKEAVVADQVTQVLKASQQPAVKTWVVVVPQDHWMRGDETNQMIGRYSAVFVYISDEHDLALCKTSLNPFENETNKQFVRPVQLEENVPADGTRLAFVGFPLHNRVPLSGSGILSSYQFEPDQARDAVLVLNANAWPGASGSPIFTENGKTVGVLTGSGTGSSRITMGRPTRWIRQLFAEAKVPFPAQ